MKNKNELMNAEYKLKEEFNKKLRNYIIIISLIALIFIYLIYPNINYKEQQQAILETKINSQMNYIQANHADVYTKYDKKNKVLKISNVDGIACVTGSSMQPTVFTGNCFIEQKYEDQILSEGMIIGYQFDNNSIAYHRIKGLYGNELIVRGDNNENNELINISRVKSIALGVIYN